MIYLYWKGLRPLSPDDTPIISNVKGFESVYINTGHGGRGLT